MIKKLMNDKNAIGFLAMGALLFVFFIIFGGIMMFLMMDMIIKNILPIAIALVLIFCLPKAIDAWAYKKDKKGKRKGGK